MALFTDGTAAGIEDLTMQDSGLLEIAVVERINLTTKLALAQEEVGLELRALLERTRNNYVFGLTSNFIRLANVVATTPVRLWVVYQTLVLIYRDAYFSQLNDRYKAKWNEFASLARWAKDKLIETGVAIATDPVSQAGAPAVTSIAAAENAGTFYLSVSFVNAAGEEGKASVPVTITTTDGNVPDVLPANVPANITGWNLYGGFSPETMFLQNGSPLDLSTDFGFYPSAALTAGQLPGNGQAPNHHRVIPRLLQRG
jgi:hypothetical protein